MNPILSNCFDVVDKVLKMTYKEIGMQLIKQLKAEHCIKFINMHMDLSYMHMRRTLLSEQYNMDVVASHNNEQTTAAIVYSEMPPTPSPHAHLHGKIHEHYSVFERVLRMAFYEIEAELLKEISDECRITFIKIHLSMCFKHLQRVILSELYNVQVDITLNKPAANNGVKAIPMTSTPTQILSSPSPLHANRTLTMKKKRIKKINRKLFQ